MKINKQNLSNLIKKTILKEQYERSMEETWMSQFNKFVDEKDPEIKNQPGYEDEAKRLYQKGFPAFDAAEMFLHQANPAQSGPIGGGPARNVRLQAFPSEDKKKENIS